MNGEKKIKAHVGNEHADSYRLTNDCKSIYYIFVSQLDDVIIIREKNIMSMDV